MKSLFSRKKILAGIISAVVGIILVIVGMSKNADPMAQVESVLSGGGTNPGTIFIVIGLILLALGIVLVVLDVLKNKKGN